MQLTIDGREVPHSVVLAAQRSASLPRLTDVQHGVLAMVRDIGSIRSVQAGVIAHNVRRRCGHGVRDATFTGRGIGCCPYAVVDGSAVLRRLEARGLVYRDPAKRGRWLAP